MIIIMATRTASKLEEEFVVRPPTVCERTGEGEGGREGITAFDARSLSMSGMENNFLILLSLFSCSTWRVSAKMLRRKRHSPRIVLSP